MGNFAANRYIRSDYDANKVQLPVVGMCAAAGGFSITADRIRGHVVTCPVVQPPLNDFRLGGLSFV